MLGGLYVALAAVIVLVVVAVVVIVARDRRARTSRRVAAPDGPAVAGGASTAGTARTSHLTGVAIAVIGLVVVGLAVGAFALTHRKSSAPAASPTGSTTPSASPSASPTKPAEATFLDGAALAWTLDVKQLAGGQDGSGWLSWGAGNDESAGSLAHGPVVVGRQWLLELYGSPERNLVAVDSLRGTVTWNVPLSGLTDCRGNADGSRAACLAGSIDSTSLVLLDMSDGRVVAQADLGVSVENIEADATGIVVAGVPPAGTDGAVTVSAWTWTGEKRWSVDSPLSAAHWEAGLSQIYLDGGMIEVEGLEGAVLLDENDGSLLANLSDVITVVGDKHVATTARGGVTDAAPSLSITPTHQRVLQADTVDGSTLLFGGSDDHSHVDRLDPATGSSLWSAQGRRSVGVVRTGDSSLFVVDRKTSLGFLDLATGATIAEAPRTGPEGFEMVIGAPGGQVVLMPPTASALNSFDVLDPRSGKVAWRLELPSDSWQVALQGFGPSLPIFETDSDGQEVLAIGNYVPAARQAAAATATP